MAMTKKCNFIVIMMSNKESSWKICFKITLSTRFWNYYLTEISVLFINPTIDSHISKNKFPQNIFHSFSFNNALNFIWISYFISFLYFSKIADIKYFSWNCKGKNYLNGAFHFNVAHISWHLGIDCKKCSFWKWWKLIFQLHSGNFHFVVFILKCWEAFPIARAF